MSAGPRALLGSRVHRNSAELLLMQDVPQPAGLRSKAEAETSFLRAIDIARRQGAGSWELRATTGLARLWQAQGKKNEARQMLAAI